MGKVEIKKEIVLKVAQEIFAKYGLTKTTIDDIAKAAGVGKSSIYYYFKNKEDIFRAVIESQVQMVGDRIKNAIDAAKTPKDIKWYKTAHTIHFIDSLLYSFRWLKEKFSSCSPKF